MVNKTQIKGMTNEATGEVKEQVGKMTNDRDLQARGHAREMKGKLQKGLGDAKETLKDTARDLQAGKDMPADKTRRNDSDR